MSDPHPNQSSETALEPKTFKARVSIRANDLDFMALRGELAAGSGGNCTDCSAISPMPPTQRQPRDRVRTKR